MVADRPVQQQQRALSALRLHTQQQKTLSTSSAAAVQVIGDDVAPGIKAGGRVNWIRRTIPCVARGDAIPQDFTVDVRCGPFARVLAAANGAMPLHG